MRNLKSLRKKLIGISLLAGGTMFAGNCINTVASLPICGAVLTFCTPQDQLRVLFPYLTTPDFSADPSCTIPLSCGGNTSNAGGNFFDTGNPTGIGGNRPDQPEDDQGGGTGGGAGGGGAGGGGV